MDKKIFVVSIGFVLLALVVFVVALITITEKLGKTPDIETSKSEVEFLNLSDLSENDFYLFSVTDLGFYDLDNPLEKEILETSEEISNLNKELSTDQFEDFGLINY